MTLLDASNQGPVRSGARVLAPDLARGFMLLLIALANTSAYMFGHGHAPMGHPVDGTAVDRAVNFALTIAVDGRSYPLFAFLFGYGMVQILRRQEDHGADRARAKLLLRRRHVWLLLFGAVHGVLLFSGDILGTYGAAGLIIGALFLFRDDRSLYIWSAVFLAVSALLLSLVAVLFGLVETVDATSGELDAGGALASAATPDPLAAPLLRLAEWPAGVLEGMLSSVLPAILLGAVAARHRLLEDPARHLPTLRKIVGVGLAVSLLGGLPAALAAAGAAEVSPSVEMWMLALHRVTGIGGGLAFAALFGILGYRLKNRRGLVTAALAAVGKRSLTCYLAQSLVFAPVLSAWGFGLGGRLDSAGIAVFAIGTWLLTVGIAVSLERSRRKGPAETLLRRRVYR
ncbi:hypothetical protein CDO52_21190 [Nocardiopsis gilva YIM 90087]|uniref:DUF418 domain-containing protein n=1 Tax=Nocardiopsis gilva YIM 90087 TaxID=1235441 RepID=A0A223SA41_9ACTN|nr:DUF418 domain-containing protein [Nocardiopsis gilva]ASU84972.1 hypothetical protein CDO52_21190 [Nocardiopsis gilva YIM 90087]